MIVTMLEFKVCSLETPLWPHVRWNKAQEEEPNNPLVIRAQGPQGAGLLLATHTTPRSPRVPGASIVPTADDPRKASKS